MILSLTVERCNQSLGRAIAVATSAAVLLLGGCSAQSAGSPGDSAAAPTQTRTEVASGVNDEDLRFAQLMEPHHDQAVSMCEMVLSKRGVKPEVRKIAEEIRKVRESQIEILNEWNQSWNPGRDVEVPEDESAPHHGGHGLMTERQMQELDLADGSAAQRLFLEGMIRHHEGAVAIAEAEAMAGGYPDAVELAKEMVATQHAEIASMQQILAQL